ncbi:zinc finger protein CONSTANS-LIKE 16-like [Carya illinoinensis]|uniref:Uncharacterized protein n=1 Tax=Carya illinoinensis TaxID=32201 RepID=A0A8T1N6Z1_CARIL|nr:zinc finger protein CONSTANS-LIKE 16-like [Carya illinoinensis]KAG6627466.1 hypothetical protein CIPAW_15G130300 [Carya illinoinensis]
MITEKKAANAMGGKTARACDSCLRRRARWFCAADDAFLCQACDASVHSANLLASRHERVRLQSSSVKPNNDTSAVVDDNSPPAWHRGFTRKARTPRHNKPILVQQAKEEEKSLDLLPCVPEIGSEEVSQEASSNDEKLLCRVPIFDPFATEFCNEMKNAINDERTTMGSDEVERMVAEDNGHDGVCELDELHGFLSSDMELANFAADVESLLGNGLDEDSCDIKGLGLLDCKEEHDIEFYVDFGEEMEKKVIPMAENKMMNGDQGCDGEMKREIFLRLDYEEVITAWPGQRSPWTTGTRPELNPDNCWRNIMGSCPKDVHHHPYGETGSVGGRTDGCREARVSRYREKRRTRLFSKKIRYEVRKLNAEKRPRMKGRFVKRTSMLVAGTTTTTTTTTSNFPAYLINK